ncbi:uncharacterized protein LAESUDRAFT_748109 [Laetiporus sulphureus 93-53]|uniref:F-box domain-containing protein n=1 Tax=Laetiporus sulphureus 93-53 TaxID=1314785 RepID=A0A165FVB3_9APHY|nr:uncharacterized protein LAESUDRAFT_748109 [Laetiporus sulphureus 93-53]KZT09457.1 hypothetical protein LAESUDRAFT_748109 [Laetiporus sulphureus 93-53]
MDATATIPSYMCSTGNGPRQLLLQPLEKMTLGQFDGMPVKQAQSHIDAQLRYFNESVRILIREGYRLKELRNALAPINSLPEEVLIEIFYIVAKTSIADIVRISRVCRHWRAIALASPKLWTNITLTKLPRAATFLRRSKNVALTYHIERIERTNSHRIDERQLRRAVAPARMRCLKASLFDAGDMDQLISTLDSPAPYLQELSLRLLKADNYTIELGLETIQTLFGDSTPSLRSLTLKQISISWTSGLYSNLAHLSVTDLSQEWLPSVDRFLEVLVQCPSLQTLDIQCLRDELPIIYEGQPASRAQRVQLPLLENLTFSYVPKGWLASVLDGVSLTSRTVMKLLALHDTEDRMRPYTMLPENRSHLPLFSNTRRFEIFSSEERLVIQLHQDASTPFIEPSCTIELHDIIPEVAFANAFSCFSLNDVEALVLCEPSPSSAIATKQQWTSMLREIPNLSSIRIIDFDSNVLSALLKALRMPGEGGLRICPQLKHLDIVGVSETTDELKNELVECVRFLSSAGCPLETVELMDLKGWSDEDVNNLRDIGVDVAFND